MDNFYPCFFFRKVGEESKVTAMKAFTLGRYQRTLVMHPIIVTFNKQTKNLLQGRPPTMCKEGGGDVVILLLLVYLPFLVAKNFQNDNINDLPPSQHHFFVVGRYVFRFKIIYQACKFKSSNFNSLLLL
jgi:hypothetical protein